MEKVVLEWNVITGHNNTMKFCTNKFLRLREKFLIMHKIITHPKFPGFSWSSMNGNIESTKEQWEEIYAVHFFESLPSFIHFFLNTSLPHSYFN